METIEIVACIDHRFTMPAGVMIHSVCKNNPDQEIRFHVVVDESVTEEDREDLRIVAGGNPILFYAVDSQALAPCHCFRAYLTLHTIGFLCLKYFRETFLRYYTLTVIS